MSNPAHNRNTLERFSLHGKVAIVTGGASSGLGVAYALALAQAGADVVLGARRGDKLAATAEQVRKYNPPRDHGAHRRDGGGSM